MIPASLARRPSWRGAGLAEQVERMGGRFFGIAYSGGGYRVSGDFQPGRNGLAIERGRLDGILRDACRAQPGFRLIEGVRAKPGDHTGFGRVLAADGIRSRWGRHFGRKVIYSDRIGLRFRLEVPPPDRVSVHFCKGLEIYLTPTGDHVLSVAFLLEPRRLGVPGGAIRETCLKIFADRFPHYAHALPRDLATRGPISTRLIETPSGIHLLGDALCAFDPITGAGMSFALLCGKLAAEHPDDPEAYYRALRPHMAAIDRFTATVLFFRGGGLRTRMMMRQLSLAPKSFQSLIALHDGSSHPRQLGIGPMLSLLRPF